MLHNTVCCHLRSPNTVAFSSNDIYIIYNTATINSIACNCNHSFPAGDTDSEEVFRYSAADPYLAEDQAFLSAVTSGDLSTVQSSYCDAASTYCLSWAIRSSSTE